MRQVFVDTPMAMADPQENHTHGVSAADRNCSSATSALVARSLGLEPYFVQMSLSDSRRGKDGDRSFYWAKDLAVPPQEFHFDPATQAAVLVDVDHYIDMPQLLARFPGTYLICSFQPQAVAKADGEYTFRFLASGEVLYRVSGGAEYSHRVWDYAGDTLLVEDAGLLQKKVTSYHVDRKHVDDHHQVILLSSIGSFNIPSALPTGCCLAGKRLERLNPVFGNHVVLDVVKKDGLHRSVAILGDHNAVTLPKSQFDAVHAVAVVAKVPITPAMVASNIAPSSSAGLPTERMPPGHAAIVAGYIRAGVPEFPPVVYPPSESMLPIWFAKHDYDAPVPLAGFGSPLIDPCYGFAASVASDDRCIAGRLEAFQGKYEKPLPPSLAGLMVEFCEFLIPDAHRGHPVGHDEVHDRQDRPSQRAILEEAGVTGPFYRRVWDAFNKKETYPKPTDPRNISQSTPPAKLAYSTYMYAFHDEVMAKQPWYAFRYTPADCAERVCDVLQDADWCVLGDGKRFDGHVGRRARILERMCLLRFLATEHHSGANEAADEQIGLPGTTEFGRRYASGYSRGSGSLETSDFNSCLTAFIDYCALRHTTVNGVKLSPEQAWARLGVYGGDDSLSTADPAAVKKSAELMGQDYGCAVVRRGEIGVKFLNRCFGPAVWHGDRNSMASPKRLLAKLWVGPRCLNQPLVRFAERLSGYYRMDRNSPVIGEICRVSHELLGDYVEGELMPWDGKHLESNWPNEDETGWMVQVFDTDIPDFDWARFRGWITAMDHSRDSELLLRAPLCTSAARLEAPVVKVPCVVGEEMVPQAPVEPPAGAVPAAPGSDAGATLSADASAELPPKEKEEADAPVALPAAVVAAEVNVPVVEAATGLKKHQRTGTAKTPQKAEGRAHERTCPSKWVEPKKRDNETDLAFRARLAKWKATRAKVAKRLGVGLGSGGS